MTTNITEGSKIRIVHMQGEPDSYWYGVEGKVTFVDDAGQIHGTWGGCALIPELDEFEVIA